MKQLSSKSSLEMFHINNHESLFPTIASQAWLFCTWNTTHDKHGVNCTDSLYFLLFHLAHFLFLSLITKNLFLISLINRHLGGSFRLQKDWTESTNSFYTPFQHTPTPPSSQFPWNLTSCVSVVYLYNWWAHAGTLLFPKIHSLRQSSLCAVHPAALDKCIMTGSHHYGIMQNHVTALENPSAPSLSPSNPWLTTDLFTVSIILTFLCFSNL